MAKLQQQVLVDRGHIHDTDRGARGSALRGCGHCLMYTAPTTDDGRPIRRAAKQTMASAQCEYVVTVVEHRGAGAHNAEVNQAAIPFHNPSHDGEHLLRTRDIND